jgi:predicted permease
MNSLINVVIPIFGIILTGYVAGRSGVLGPDSAFALSRFVFSFALPPALLIFTARAPIEKMLNWPFIAAYLGGSLGVVFIVLLVGRFWLRQDAAKLCLSKLTVVQANVIYLGLPLLLAAFGPDGALPTIIAGLIITLLFTCTGTAALEGIRAPASSKLRATAQLIGAVARNPLILSTGLGIILSASAVTLPQSMSNYLDPMAATVGPAALFALGLSLSDRKLTGNFGEVIWLTALKVIVSPLLTFALVSYVFVVEPMWAKAAIILSAMPTGANVYIIAQQYKAHIETVSSTIVVSTAASLIAMPLLLIWLGIG